MIIIIIKIKFLKFRFAGVIKRSNPSDTKSFNKQIILQQTNKLTNKPTNQQTNQFAGVLKRSNPSDAKSFNRQTDGRMQVLAINMN